MTGFGYSGQVEQLQAKFRVCCFDQHNIIAHASLETNGGYRNHHSITQSSEASKQHNHGLTRQDGISEPALFSSGLTDNG